MLQRPDLLRRHDRAGAGYRSGIRLRDRSGTGSGRWQDRSGARSSRDQAPGSLREVFWDVAGSLRGQDRSGIRLQDLLLWQDLWRWQERFPFLSA